MNMNKFFKTIKEYWMFITFVVGAISAAAIFPFRLEALESRQNEFEQNQQLLVQQTTTIGKWVEQEQKEKEYKKERQISAPPGWRWDATTRQYVVQ